jgi:hypothetical protein
MAVTHTKKGLSIVLHDTVLLETITRVLPEGASQTFPAGSPLAFSSGLLVVFVAPTTALLAAFTEEVGHNTTGARTTCVLAVPGVEIEANFLGAAAADNVIAAADMGGKFDLLSSSTLIGGASAGWYISDATADPSVRLSAFAPLREANRLESVGATGDTNCRVRATPIQTKTHWNAT